MTYYTLTPKQLEQLDSIYVRAQIMDHGSVHYLSEAAQAGRNHKWVREPSEFLAQLERLLAGDSNWSVNGDERAKIP